MTKRISCIKVFNLKTGQKKYLSGKYSNRILTTMITKIKKSTVQWPAARRSGCACGEIRATVRLCCIEPGSPNSKNTHTCCC